MGEQPSHYTVVTVINAAVASRCTIIIPRKAVYHHIRSEQALYCFINPFLGSMTDFSRNQIKSVQYRTNQVDRWVVPNDRQLALRAK